MLPADVLAELRDRFGEITPCEPIGGGCITPACRVRLGTGRSAFVKHGGTVPPSLFTVEAEGLLALRAAATSLLVPEVYLVGTAAGGYLVMEWLEPAPRGAGFGVRLGEGLAELHRTTGRWGWDTAGFIGPLAVENAESSRWAEFWRDRRLLPQLERAEAAGWRVGRPREWEVLWRLLDDLLAPAEADGPSLLHGDLWSGNMLAAEVAGDVVPALVDPAVYYGHREVDLAMAELFGGFPADFLRAYEGAWPLQPGYRRGRRAAYQLFYLLVHVNLFGGAYVRGAERALREAIAAG
jgi:fructosamine-3-kinase